MTHRGSLTAVLLLLICASLAGCLADDKAKPAPADDTTDVVDDSNSTVDTNTTTDVEDDATETVESLGPVAAFVLEINDTLAVGDSFTANATSTSDDDTAAENLTFSWDFGDGNTAEGITAVHSFAAEGNYTIILNVTDPEGNVDSANETVVVVSGFTAGLVASLTGTIAAPNPVVGELALAYAQASAACGTSLECFKTVGGVEGTHFEIHTVSGLPMEAGTLIFEDIGAGEVKVDFALFDEDGNKIGNNNVGPNTASSGGRKTTLPSPYETVQVFVFMHVGANAAYDISVTTVAPEA